ncbi:TPA: acyltransferase family protein [Klebsiella aerogenes]|nr:acyltransferase family protein [Klebsiella aerogenes]
MERIFWLDASRAIAIALVVFTHSHEQAGIHSELLRSIFYSIDRLGVPIFFMISGGLVLPRAAKSSILSFYRKRIPQFIILIFLWSVITNTVNTYASGSGFIDSVSSAFINYNGIYPGHFGAAAQLWFMYSITQLYLIAPFLGRLLKSLTNKEILIFILICVLLNQIKVTGSFYGGEWGALFWMGGDFTGSYISYFMVGYLVLERGILDDVKFNGVIPCLMITIIPLLILVATDIATHKVNDVLHWYTGSLFIFISGVGLFVLRKNIFENLNSRFLSIISACSFGVYLSHYAFMYAIKWVVNSKGFVLSDIEKVLVYFSLSFILSLTFTWIVMRVKYLKYFIS